MNVCVMYSRTTEHCVFLSVEPHDQYSSDTFLYRATRLVNGSVGSTENESSVRTPGVRLSLSRSCFDNNLELTMSSNQPFVLRWGIISTGTIAATFVSVSFLVRFT